MKTPREIRKQAKYFQDIFTNLDLLVRDDMPSCRLVKLRPLLTLPAGLEPARDLGTAARPSSSTNIIDPRLPTCDCDCVEYTESVECPDTVEFPECRESPLVLYIELNDDCEPCARAWIGRRVGGSSTSSVEPEIDMVARFRFAREVLGDPVRDD